MILNLIIVYLIIVLLSYRYCNLNSVSNVKSPKFIVILSASIKFVTKQRVATAIMLKRAYPNAKIIACGKFHSDYMKGLLQKEGIIDYMSQSKSTNTYEDAIFTKEIMNNKKSYFALITSPTHQRRAFNTFKRVFSNKILLKSSSLFLSLDSILLPIGWVCIIIESYKDIKYNQNILGG